MAEISLVEEVSHLNANDSIPDRLLSLHSSPHIAHMRLLSRSQPYHHVQRLSLLVPLPCLLQTDVHNQEDQARCEWKQKR